MPSGFLKKQERAAEYRRYTLIDKHRQPVIIGIGELCERVPKNVTTASSPLDLMEQASLAACRDSGIPDKVIEALDVLAVVRTFADSTPMYPNPFGRVNNYPRAVARRIGAQPRAAIYTHAGGNTPQALVTEFSERIAAGDNSLVLLVGGEAIGTTKSAVKADVKLQWGDDTGGQIEDRGLGLDSIIDRQQIDNGLATAPLMYGLLENARRSAQGNSREEYADEMGKLFQAFTEVAAQHPVAAFPKAYSVAELIEVSDTNPPISAPYTRHLVAKDGVNQAAAVVLTSVARALELGVPRGKMVFPVTGSNVHDRYLVQRPNLASSEAMMIAYRAVLESSCVAPEEISLLDLYSCFPIAVFNACEALGIDPLGGRALTLTGGLPFFGGAGNNYSMHSIVNVASQLRERRTGYGLVGANGGILSKHAVGMYSAEPPENGWSSCDHKALQSLFDSEPCLEVDPHASGPAVIETYSIDYKKGIPKKAYIVARTIEGKRFIAHSDPGDAETPQRMHADDPIGKTVYVTSAGLGTRFSYSHSSAASLVPKRVLEQENSLACDGDAAWQVLADFGNFLAWATGGAGTARLEGDGVGMTRHLDIPELGLVSERLDRLDHASRTLAYSMVSETMAGMARYSATVQVITEGAGRCALRWRGDFEPLPGIESEEVENSLAGSYTLMSHGLEAFVNAQA
jgi:acetyl-CoA C-acetyltransferase